MTHRYPIGEDDFRRLREDRLEYVDKTQLIQGILDDAGTRVFLFPRPRRFGKSLNLSMLRCWFEQREDDLSHLFLGTRIWEAGEPYRAHFQRYPVLFLDLKDTRYARWEDCRSALRLRISELVHAHRHVLDHDELGPLLRRQLQEILAGTADDVTHGRVLRTLSEALHQLHGESVVILVDEYDEPIHAGHQYGYAEQAIEFVRALLSSGLKGSPFLFKGVLTGALRVARESIYTGLNNLGVYTLLSRDFNTCYGFTEPELRALLERNGCGQYLDDVRRWYDGYLFGGEVIYNPWSVLNFLRSSDKLARPYWLNTSSNDLVREQLRHHALTLHRQMQDLLEGRPVVAQLQESVALQELKEQPDALWSLLVFSGYLKARQVSGSSGELAGYELSIPNREVHQLYTGTFQQWMREQLPGGTRDVERLTEAMFRGDAERLEHYLGLFALHLLTHHRARGVEAEDVYRGFVVGLCAVLEPEYQVRAEQESGQGRPDVTIRPVRAGKPGVILELKVARKGKKTLEQALEEGLAQIREKDYEAELRACGASPIQALAVAFDGKTVAVRSARESGAAVE